VNTFKGLCEEVYRINEILGARLATIHNLHYYLTLMAELREAIVAGNLSAYARRFAEQRDSGGAVLE
jgi:queuine tRNA-ribosyltransferase